MQDSFPAAIGLAAFAAVPIAFLLLFRPGLFVRRNAGARAGRPMLLLWTLLLVWAFAAPLLVSVYAVNVRLFAPLVPLILIAVPGYLCRLLPPGRTLPSVLLLLVLAFQAFVCVATLMNVDLLPGDNASVFGRAYHYVLDGVGTGWLREAVAFLELRNATKEDLVLTTFSQLPLLFHTDYNVQTVWSVRKGYIDGYQKRMFLLEEPEPFLRDHCEYFYAYHQPQTHCGENANYHEKISQCSAHPLASGATVYECN